MEGDRIALADTVFDLKFEIWKGGAHLSDEVRDLMHTTMPNRVASVRIGSFRVLAVELLGGLGATGVPKFDLKGQLSVVSLRS
jgi:hypothetical protein